MDSQFFNRKRFIALCRWDWTERQKALGLHAVVIYAVLTVFSSFYTIRGALRANALSHYVSPQRVEEWKAISADLAQGVDGSWTSVSALFFPILAFYLVGTARRTQRALQTTSQATRTLTFPVSTFEQFLLRWLYAVPLALLTYCAVFVAADVWGFAASSSRKWTMPTCCHTLTIGMAECTHTGCLPCST